MTTSAISVLIHCLIVLTAPVLMNAPIAIPLIIWITETAKLVLLYSLAAYRVPNSVVLSVKMAIT